MKPVTTKCRTRTLIIFPIADIVLTHEYTERILVNYYALSPDERFGLFPFKSFRDHDI